MSVTLTKIAETAPGLLSLAKNAVTAIDASGLNGQKAKVAFVADFSGSMGRQYQDGTVQRLAEKILAVATQFDDDGAVDVFVFDSSAAYLGEVSIDNYQGSIDRLTKGRRMGTTDYAGAFKLVEKHYGYEGLGAKIEKPARRGLFGKKVAPAPTVSPLAKPAAQPVYVVFLTDGVPNNQSEAVSAIINASYAPIFWQFLSIGRESIPFLEKLDDLDGRYIDNADYKAVGDVDKLTDTDLFKLLFDEYPDWVKEERSRGQIV